MWKENRFIQQQIEIFMYLKTMRDLFYYIVCQNKNAFEHDHSREHVSNRSRFVYNITSEETTCRGEGHEVCPTFYYTLPLSDIQATPIIINNKKIPVAFATLSVAWEIGPPLFSLGVESGSFRCKIKI